MRTYSIFNDATGVVADLRHSGGWGRLRGAGECFDGCVSPANRYHFLNIYIYRIKKRVYSHVHVNFLCTCVYMYVHLDTYMCIYGCMWHSVALRVSLLRLDCDKIQWPHPDTRCHASP